MLPTSALGGGGIGSRQLALARSNGEPLASLEYATLQGVAAPLGARSGPEAVHPRAPSFSWLIGSFRHESFPEYRTIIVTGENRCQFGARAVAGQLSLDIAVGVEQPLGKISLGPWVLSPNPNPNPLPREEGTLGCPWNAPR